MTMSFISMFSVLGIAIGVAVIVTVMSVMNGFQSEVKNRMLGILPHAKIMGLGGSLENRDALQAALIANKDVKSFSAFVSSEALLLGSKEVSGIQFKGIDPKESGSAQKLEGLMVQGQLDSMSNGSFNIVLGKGLADDLNLSLGDPVTVMIPNSLISAMGVIPRLKRFTVSGFFEAGVYEFDRNLAFANLLDAQTLLQMPGKISGMEIDFFDPKQSREMVRKIAIGSGGGYTITDWTVQNPNFFRSLELTKTIIFMVLVLILAVASFNIVSTLVMLIKQKKASIAVLRSLGVDHMGIFKIFLAIGLLLGLAGSILGIGFGILVTEQLSGIVQSLESILGVTLYQAEIYFLSELPTEIHWLEVLWIGLLAVLLSLVSSIIPSYRASRLNPADVLRSHK
ncbi:MAG TPA: lipoprotein-releasing ABC transporter permease subunit [Gammaproteobacteria bacterium]|nr:lipoprotein-releasing ABC transporter permease subunit [Gammaproteobacteria bacterium]